MDLKRKPILSIITVVYNGEKYLEQTIKSVINQNISNIEYIIIDGGSTDGTIDIVKKYSDSISYWVSEPDFGIYDAINKGIKASSGKYIGIINSDDWYEQNVLSQLAEKFDSEESDIICGLLRLWDDNKVMGIQGNTSDFLVHGMISHPTCFVKKSVYNEIGEFNTKYKIAGDYDFMMRCLKKGYTFSFQEFVIANFRLNGVSNQNAELRRIEFAEILFKNDLISKKKYDREVLIQKVKKYIF